MTVRRSWAFGRGTRTASWACRIVGPWLAGLLGALVAAGVARAESPGFDLDAFRYRIATDRAAGLAEGFALLDAGTFRNDPTGERMLLWYMGGAAVGSADDAALARITGRLDALAHRDPVAAPFAGFIRGARLLDTGRKAEGLVQVLESAAAIDVSIDAQLARIVAGELCRSYAAADRPEDGLRHCRRLTLLVAETDDTAALARAEYLEASVLSTAGRQDESVPLWRSARQRFLALGLDGLADRTAGSLAGDLLLAGQATEALDMARIALAAAERAGSATSIAFATAPLAEALIQLGDPSAAAGALEHALAALDGVDLPGLEANLLRLMEAALSAMDGAEAARLEAVRTRRAELEATLAMPADSDRIEALERALRERDFELRIRDLERDTERKDLALANARLEAELRERRLGTQRAITWLAVAAAVGLFGALAAAVLLLRAQRRLALQLETMALRDALTGLPNRRALTTAAARLVTPDGAIAPGHALLLVDLDHFKSINDRGGHPFGDRVLAAVAEALSRVAPAGSLVARLGGEEFALLCPGLGREAAARLAEGVRAAVEGLRFDLDGVRVPVTASLGVAATSQGHPLELSHWLAAADAALYRAKADGRNRVVLAD